MIKIIMVVNIGEIEIVIQRCDCICYYTNKNSKDECNYSNFECIWFVWWLIESEM